MKKAFQTTSDSFRDGGIAAHIEKASNESFGKKRRKFREKLTKIIFGVTMRGIATN
ncbi:MAG: hypothetical protein LH614_02900 [Pyrinomonadaceae bacterium]|nr:hypothetical protein [Pyrinomonadaceae bacterium]